MDGERPRGHRYRLVLRGELSDRLGTLFGGMWLERHAGTTSLTGWVVDQVQLVGLIERAQELGLELVSIGPDEGTAAGSADHAPRSGAS